MISFQNGVSNVDLLKQALRRPVEIARGMVPFNVAALGNGRWHKGVAGDLCGRGSRVTRRSPKRIGNGPAALELSDDMVGVAWGKLLINLNNAVNALSGKTLLEELQRPQLPARVRGGADRGSRHSQSAPGSSRRTVGPIPPD